MYIIANGEHRIPETYVELSRVEVPSIGCIGAITNVLGRASYSFT